MNNSLMVYAVIGVIALLGGAFILTQPQAGLQVPAEASGTAMEKDGSAMVDDEPAMMEDSDSKGRAMVSAAYELFTAEKYEAAKAEGKTIFLEFYANWCPSCAAQKPVLQSAIPKLDGSRLAAFQVNFNDSDTDGREKELAKKFGVTYQHTHIIADASENVLLRGIGQWSEQQVKENIVAFLN